MLECTQYVSGQLSVHVVKREVRTPHVVDTRSIRHVHLIGRTKLRGMTGTESQLPLLNSTAHVGIEVH